MYVNIYKYGYHKNEGGGNLSSELFGESFVSLVFK